MTPLDRFNALPARQRDEILDKHRHWNVDLIEWWDAVYDCFKRDMDAIGIDVDRMYFSGFSSQGDGACFEGNVDDWPKFLESVGYTCPALTALAAESWRLSVVHRGHYYHENCTHFSSDMVSPDDYSESEMDEFVYAHSPYKTDIQNAAFVAILKGYNFSSLEDEFEEAFKAHMRALYNQLEAEYDDLTSDESVLSSLDANDMLTEIIDELENEYA
jgi:hypothetical protein